MASGNNRRDANTSYALSITEKKMLAETRSFSKQRETKIKEDIANFSEKGSWGLWWDAKGFFNCSDAAEVTPHMERYRKLHDEISKFPDLVEKNDPNSYDKLYDIYNTLEEAERDASLDVESNRSKAICQMLRQFLNEKYKLDHNLKKVECIVMKQKMKEIEQDSKSSKDEVIRMSRKMDELIDENRAVRRESEEKLQRVLEEAEEKSEARILEIRRQTEKLRLEAERRDEAARRESEERLSKLIEENKGMKEIVDLVRREKEEAESRSEAVRLESEERLKRVLEESEERLKRVLQESEERSGARLREMAEEAERHRLEAEKIRRESDEKLKQAVEEANRRSEARMQETAEQNRANLQKMTKLLEKMTQ